MKNTKYLLNDELNGVEIYFSDKPNINIRKNLKENKFRWNKNKKCWYAKQSEKTVTFTKSISNNGITDIKPVQTEIKKNISLWDSTRWQNIEVDRKQETKIIASEIKKHVKNRFPMCKFSVRSTYSNINFEILESPFKKSSEYLQIITEYCTSLIKNYQYCTCYDPYADYGSSYNFYSARAEISYNYKQTEQTENIKEMIKDFDIKKEENDRLEQELQEQKYKEQEKERELKEERYKEEQEEEKKQIKDVYNNTKVVTLEEKKQYFILKCKFANLNKNDTLTRYKKEVKKGDYSLNNVKVTKEVHFNNKKTLENFSNMLLNDFDFLTGTGGSYTDDNRINDMTDYSNMTKEERKTVKWYILGVAIYFNNELQFVVDTQGYSYARYVGLVG